MCWVLVLAGNIAFITLGNFSDLTYTSAVYYTVMTDVAYSFIALEFIVAFETMHMIETPLKVAINPKMMNKEKTESRSSIPGLDSEMESAPAGNANKSESS